MSAVNAQIRAEAWERLQQLLSPAELRAVEEFQRRLLAALPGQVRGVILFGSKARGDHRAGSDIDLLVVFEGNGQQGAEVASNITADILLAQNIDISPITFERAELERQQELGSPLMRNIAEEGIVLMGEAIVVGDGKPDEVAARFLESARERLRAAEHIMAGGFYRSVVSLAFYAFLDAADGALAARRITPKSHAGTISLFGLHFIKSGLVDAKYSRWFKRIRKQRLAADYERARTFTREEAQEALEQATEFVALIEKLLPTLSSQE